MPIRSSIAALALCLVPLCSLQGQYPAEDKPYRSLLYGRRETASVDLARLGSSTMDDLLPWRHRDPPLTPGTSTAARLTSDLPFTIGKLLVPAGTYLLQLEAPRTLVIRSQVDPGRGESSFNGRVELADVSSGVQVLGWTLAVVTTRLGDDTLGVVEARVRGMNVTTIQHGPGTRSMLRLRYLDRELSAPISAR